MYSYILLPGRTHAITNFQIDYLNAALSAHQAMGIDGTVLSLQKDCSVVWAITSGNHANTRRNPLPGVRRLAMAELASQALCGQASAYLIPNKDQKADFAHYVIEEIRIQSKGMCLLTPQNTIVACSTPAVIKQYQAYGYAVIPVELERQNPEVLTAPRPWDIIEEIIRSGDAWHDGNLVRTQLHPACLQYYHRYNLANHIRSIFDDPLTSSEGNITETRDYESYRAAFEENAFRKVDAFAPYVQPGRIVDVGCATGQTIKLLCTKPELFESDFYGIEAARPLYAICEQRQHNGAFGNANVFFYQRNIMHSEIFPVNSVNTIITMALTHEIESYMGRQSLLDFIQRMYDMLVPGGVYINYDVVGPQKKDTDVWVTFTEDDGANPTDLYPPEAANDSVFLKTLSSRSRFLRFCEDFRKEEHDTITVRTELIDGVEYFVLPYGDVCEFLAKKDYTESWFSEMHERFCFWGYTDWTNELAKVGFQLHQASTAVQNPWLIKHRFAPAAQIYSKNKTGSLIPVPHPDTNSMLIAQKPL